jgi:hypothetical protein
MKAKQVNPFGDNNPELTAVIKQMIVPAPRPYSKGENTRAFEAFCKFREAAERIIDSREYRHRAAICFCPVQLAHSAFGKHDAHLRNQCR